jgi:DNA-binding NarL/FixJ family response regulator
MGVASRYRPDVIVLDIRLNGEDGLVFCREVRKRFPPTQVVILTSYGDEDYIREALRSGAVGFVLKRVGNDELLRAVLAASRGESVFDPVTGLKIAGRMRELENRSEIDAFRDLSRRELQVLALVARGLSNKEIGFELQLSDVTARNYVGSILDKLGLHNRVELAIYAVKHHIDERLT